MTINVPEKNEEHHLNGPSAVLSVYGLDQKDLTWQRFGSGLINHTWRVSAGGQEYILQKVNVSVFHHPGDIAHNISLIEAHLKKHHPDYFFVAPVKTAGGEDLVKADGYYRLFPFVRDTHSVDVVQTSSQAREAAMQFGMFTRLLCGLDARLLRITIPSFHDLSLRYRQFGEALQHGNKERIRASAELVRCLLGEEHLVQLYERIKSGSDFRIRVTHHDTKISNVLFDAQDRGVCVIDLDTVMPGYFISDAGDMLRTYLSPVDENEADFSRIGVREDFYEAIVQGYVQEMGAELGKTEKSHFLYAGKFMIYMQALRFLTDYLNNDRYYGSAYEGQNFVRAGNQWTLYQRLCEKKDVLERLTRQWAG